MSIQSLIPFESSKILNIYSYGSRVYGTILNDKEADYDYIAVVDSKILSDQRDIRSDKVDITLYNPYEFQAAVDEHEISALECLWLPADKVIQETKKFDFNLNLPALRKSISAKASNSYVKAKKKLTVPEDYDHYLAKKSMFHSLRILIFGTQIAKFGKIVDYTEANKYWTEMMFDSIITWERYHKKYKPIYNALATEFRKYAPKEE